MINPDNVVTISGRLTADATSVMDGKLIQFSIAVDRAGYEKGSDNNTGFFNCKIWTMENKWTSVGFLEMVQDLLANGRLSKGAPVRIVGELNHDRYEDAQGNRRSEVGIVVSDIRSFAKSTEGSSSTGSEPTPQASATTASGAKPF